MTRASQPGAVWLVGCRTAVRGCRLHHTGLSQVGVWVQKPKAEGNCHSTAGSAK